jgi:hypothetical protein
MASINVLTILDWNVLEEVQGIIENLGFNVDAAFTHDQAKDALRIRPYDAIITSVSTEVASLFDDEIFDKPNRRVTYKSSFLRSLIVDFPDTFRIIYGYDAMEVEDIRHSCFECGADAVSSTPENIVDILLNIANYLQIQHGPDSNQIKCQELLNLAGGMVSHRLQRNNQLPENIDTMNQGNQIQKNQNVMQKCSPNRKDFSYYKSKVFKTIGSGLMVRIVQVSDTLGDHRSLLIPEGDLFLHAGNFTSGKVETCLEQFHDFLDWIHEVVLTKCKHVAFISGEKDMFLDIIACKYNAASREARKILNNFLCNHPTVAFLENSSITYHGLKIFGSPTTLLKASNLSQDDYKAFERNVQSFVRAPIDDECDILLTHRPPSFLYVEPNFELPSENLYFSQAEAEADDVKIPKRRFLLKKVKKAPKVVVKRAPTIHTFGHYGDDFGIEQYERTFLVNCSQESVLKNDKNGGGIPLVVHMPMCE